MVPGGLGLHENDHVSKQAGVSAWLPLHAWMCLMGITRAYSFYHTWSMISTRSWRRSKKRICYISWSWWSRPSVHFLLGIPFCKRKKQPFTTDYLEEYYYCMLHAAYNIYNPFQTLRNINIYYYSFRP